MSEAAVKHANGAGDGLADLVPVGPDMKPEAKLFETLLFASEPFLHLFGQESFRFALDDMKGVVMQLNEDVGQRLRGAPKLLQIKRLGFKASDDAD